MIHIIGYVIALALSYFIYNTKHGYTNLTHIYFASIAVFLNGHDLMELACIHFVIDTVLQYCYNSLCNIVLYHHILAVTGGLTALYTGTENYFWYGAIHEIPSVIFISRCMDWLSEYNYNRLIEYAFPYFRFFLFNYCIFQTDFIYHPAPLFFWVCINIMNVLLAYAYSQNRL